MNILEVHQVLSRLSMSNLTELFVGRSCSETLRDQCTDRRRLMRTAVLENRSICGPNSSSEVSPVLRNVRRCMVEFVYRCSTPESCKFMTQVHARGALPRESLSS